MVGGVSVVEKKIILLLVEKFDWKRLRLKSIEMTETHFIDIGCITEGINIDKNDADLFVQLMLSMGHQPVLFHACGNIRWGVFGEIIGAPLKQK